MVKPRKTNRPSVVDSVIAAVDALRRGRPVAIRGAGGSVLARALETLDAKGLAAARCGGKLRLVLTHARARTLKIRLYTPEIVALAIPDDMGLDILRAVADPTEDLAYPLKGPFETARGPLPDAYGAAVKLAKLAGLLPAIVLTPLRPADKPSAAIRAADIRAYDDEIIRTLKIVARARVPLEAAERAEMVSFRPADGGPEHYAIVIGAPPLSKPVLARFHSECFTGDLLGSLKCDCGQQLRGAIAAIAMAGGGVLLYLAQEGRGIGLINKLRAYSLQDQGFDTIDANERLGFEADERQFGLAARMFELLGFKSVRLMTNNPDKVAALKAAGIKVVARVPHAFEDNVHNRGYLRTKAARAGHFL